MTYEESRLNVRLCACAHLSCQKSLALGRENKYKNDLRREKGNSYLRVPAGCVRGLARSSGRGWCAWRASPPGRGCPASWDSETRAPG